MSGGSFEYLCFQDGREIWTHEYSLESMGDFLAGLGYAEDAAKETYAILGDLRRARVQMEARLEAMSALWHDAEWWQSADSGEDTFVAQLMKWREEGLAVSR